MNVDETMIWLSLRFLFKRRFEGWNGLRRKIFTPKTDPTLSLSFSAVIALSWENVEKRQWFNQEIALLLFPVTWKLTPGTLRITRIMGDSPTCCERNQRWSSTDWMKSSGGNHTSLFFRRAGQVRLMCGTNKPQCALHRCAQEHKGPLSVRTT